MCCRWGSGCGSVSSQYSVEWAHIGCRSGDVCEVGARVKREFRTMTVVVAVWWCWFNDVVVHGVGVIVGDHVGVRRVALGSVRFFGGSGGVGSWEVEPMIGVTAGWGSCGVVVGHM